MSVNGKDRLVLWGASEGSSPLPLDSLIAEQRNRETLENLQNALARAQESVSSALRSFLPLPPANLELPSIAQPTNAAALAVLPQPREERQKRSHSPDKGEEDMKDHLDDEPSSSLSQKRGKSEPTRNELLKSASRFKRLFSLLPEADGCDANMVREFLDYIREASIVTLTRMLKEVSSPRKRVERMKALITFRLYSNESLAKLFTISDQELQEYYQVYHSFENKVHFRDFFVAFTPDQLRKFERLIVFPSMNLCYLIKSGAFDGELDGVPKIDLFIRVANALHSHSSKSDMYDLFTVVSDQNLRLFNSILQINEATEEHKKVLLKLMILNDAELLPTLSALSTVELIDLSNLLESSRSNSRMIPLLLKVPREERADLLKPLSIISVDCYCSDRLEGTEKLRTLPVSDRGRIIDGATRLGSKLDKAWFYWSAGFNYTDFLQLIIDASPEDLEAMIEDISLISQLSSRCSELFSLPHIIQFCKTPTEKRRLAVQAFKDLAPNSLNSFPSLITLFTQPLKTEWKDLIKRAKTFFNKKFPRKYKSFENIGDFLYLLSEYPSITSIEIPKSRPLSEIAIFQFLAHCALFPQNSWIDAPLESSLVLEGFLHVERFVKSFADNERDAVLILVERMNDLNLIDLCNRFLQQVPQGERISILEQILNFPTDERVDLLEKAIQYLEGLNLHGITVPSNSNFFIETFKVLGKIPLVEREEVIKRAIDLWNPKYHWLTVLHVSTFGRENNIDNIHRVLTRIPSPPNNHNQTDANRILGLSAYFDPNTLEKLLQGLGIPQVSNYRSSSIQDLLLRLLLFPAIPNLTETVHSSLMQNLDAETNERRIIWLCKMITTNYACFCLYPEHPLVQHAAMKLAALESTKANSNHPTNIFAQVKQMSQERTPQINIPKENSLTVRREGFLENMQEQTRTRAPITLSQFPQPLPFAEVKRLFNGIEARMNNNEPLKNHIRDMLGDFQGTPITFQEVKNDFNHPLLQALANPTTNPDESVHVLYPPFYSVIRYIADQPHILTPETLLTQREEVLLKIAISMYACQKPEGLIMANNLLPIKSRFGSREHGEIPIVEKGKRYLYEAMQRAINDIFGGEGPFLRELTQADPTRPIAQLTHQTIYLKNALSTHVGFEHPLRFDTGTLSLYDALVLRELKSLLEAFYRYATPSYFIRALQTFINQDSDEELYQKLNSVLGNSLPLNEAWDVHPETGKFTLTERGAKTLLNKTGYIL